MGQFYFNKLPFGTSSAHEHFQKRMSAILNGLEGVIVQMDNILGAEMYSNSLESGICHNPLLVSSLVNTFAPESSASVSSTF